MNNLLQGRKIAVAVTGSIAIYKTLELIRIFVKSGADVRVVMSTSAEKFIAPLTFEAISGHLVLTDSNESWADEVEGKAHNHIGLAKWAEVFVIAPASANTIAKLANGIADNLLTQSLLAHRGKKIIAPSANTAMIEHPITKGNLKMLSLCGYESVEPVTKLLACGDEGNGAMAEVNDIFWASARALLRDEFYEYRNVVISGGGSVEKIDDVRFVGNFSSGKMSSSLALAFYALGADVTLVTSTPNGGLPQRIVQTKATSGAEFLAQLQGALDAAKEVKTTKPSLMHSAQIQSIAKKPLFVMAAAIADYVPKNKSVGKLKKEKIGSEFALHLVQSDDILKTLDRQNIISVGFKAEFDKQNAKKSSEKMLKEKNLDAVCLNVLGDDIGFGSDENEVCFLTNSKEHTIARGDKLGVALEISRLIKLL